MTDESSAMARPYEIVLIRRAVPPPGGKGSNWYRYVIAFEGTNIIRGCRQGGLKAVTRAVNEIVAQLNERQLGTPSRVHLVLTKKSHKRRYLMDQDVEKGHSERTVRGLRDV